MIPITNQIPRTTITELLPNGSTRQRDIINIPPTQAKLLRLGYSNILCDESRLIAIENQLTSMVEYQERVSPSANLDNCIRDETMPDVEGDAIMHRRQQLTIAGKTQWHSFASTQELVNLVTEQVKAAMQPQSSNVIFGDYMSNWYHQYKKRTISKNYQENYESIMKVHIIPAIGDKSIGEISVADVQAIVDTLKSASYAKQTKCLISMVMDAAIADELYFHPNPAKDPRIVMPTTVKKREAVDKDDLSTIMDTLPKMPSELASILALLIMTGSRRGEALGARWEDIDWTTKTIHLQRVVRFHHNRPEVSDKMKTKAANRIVSIWDELIPYLGQRKETGYIINSEGEPLSETQYRHRWNAIMRHLKAAGIEERFTAHQLRHSYATMAANSGKIPPKVLQGMLGHANFQTTMNIYAGLDDDRIRESSQSLSGEYSKLTLKSCTEIAAPETAKAPAPSVI